MIKNCIRKAVAIWAGVCIFAVSMLGAFSVSAADISRGISVSLWNTTGSGGELTYACIGFPQGVLDPTMAYGILDREDYKYIGDYLYFGGKSVNEINASTDTSGYAFYTFPSTADVKYRLPIILFQNGNNIEIKVHHTYLSTLLGDPEIMVKSGLSFSTGDNRFDVLSDVSFVYQDGVWIGGTGPEEQDITEEVSLSLWNTTGNAAELKYTVLTFPNGVLPAGIDYGILDREEYRYIGDYIAVNGKTVNEINASTDTSGYTFSTFPSNADPKYRLPVILFQNGNTIEIKIHSRYLSDQSGELCVSVLQGLSVSNGNTISIVSEDVSYVLQNDVWVRLGNAVDLADFVSLDGFAVTGNGGELRYTIVTFDDEILPNDIGYGVIDREAYHYIGDYLAVNGKTVNEINASTDVSGYTFHTFPSTADDKYKLPVIVLQNGNTLEIKVHQSFADALLKEGSTDKIIVSLLKGLSFVKDGKPYILQNDVDYVAFRQAAPTDISNDIKIDGFNVTGDQNELKYTVISFKKGELPQDIGYGVLDNNNYRYIGDYLTVNGKTVNEINASTNTKNYSFHTFPSTADDKYKLPIIVLQNGNTLEVKLHSRYIADALNGQNITIGVRSGLQLNNGGRIYTVTKGSSTRIFTYVSMKQKTIGDLSVSKWQTAGDSGEYKSTLLTFPAGVLPKGIFYGAIDTAENQYILDYIRLNGKTLAEINRTVSTKGYRFDSFPANEMDYFRLPVIVYISGNTVELRIHQNYLNALRTDTFTVDVLKGLSFTGGRTVYTLAKTMSFTNRPGIWQGQGDLIDVHGGLNAFGWVKEGETTHSVYLEFGEYPVLLNLTEDAYSYGGSLTDYITVNGKTVTEINRTASVKGYRWDTFPSTEMDRYKVPVILYANAASNTLQVRIHDRYLQGQDEITVGVNTDFLVERSGKSSLTYYFNSEPVEFVRIGDVWSNRNRRYTVTYFLNGKVYGKPAEYGFRDAVSMIGSPEIGEGYAFSGWRTESDFKDGILADAEVYGYLRPIRYAILYDLAGGTNDPKNPIFYDVESGEIQLRNPVNGTMRFEGWYTDKNYTHKINSLPAGSTGDIRLYARFTGKQKKSFDFGGFLDSSVPYIILALLAVAAVLLFIPLFKREKNSDRETAT